MIALTTFILNIIAIIAISVFIIYTVTVHKHMNDVLKRMNKTIDDISIHLNIIKETNDNLAEIHNKLNICINGITEIISKQRYNNKAIDQLGNRVATAIVEYNQQIKAKISSVLTQSNNSPSMNKKGNTKLKTAKTNSFNKKNKRKNK